MSFEFDLEEQAKTCIANVSNLYKKLKNTQKRSSKKTDKSLTEESESLKSLQIKAYKPTKSLRVIKVSAEKHANKHKPERAEPRPNPIAHDRVSRRRLCEKLQLSNRQSTNTKSK